MTYRVELSLQAEDALAELPEEGRREVMKLIATALLAKETWPAPGGWETAERFGPRSWITFAAYADGMDVLRVGWVG
ncbi:hypothetical protein [Streptomyces sp. NRRL B-3229]|uniref:hypothetical protein n=1 Tax=Streptomyces sp. NRRL B-3229 TaxID=1463836 RepID=UPI0004BFA6CD|nr:hypothetical protein [Streptomyces sp. NRRL B-3229]